MNLFIETLNHWGGYFLKLTWPMFWQSSLLIATLFLLDVLFRRHLRAAIRYALWLVVLVKLLLPPTLALPTGAAWWLIPVKPVASPLVARQYHYSVTYDDAFQSLDFTAPSVPLPPPPPPKLEPAGWWLLAAATVSAVLLLWLTFRWWQVRRVVRSAIKADDYSETLLAAVRLAGAPNSGSACLKNHHQCAGSQTGVPGVRLKLVEEQMSPAVCGLFQPVILLPRELAEKLSAEQLRAVLLHELFHLRRGDVWVNCAQALFQIVYWWHPLLWLANARIRRLREEAVDDAVMLALRDKAETYAPTLLEVAKLAFRRPLMSLGLVGILESRSALRQRIERLVEFHAPRKAGLTLVSLLGILAFTAVAVPMGQQAPRQTVRPEATHGSKAETQKVATHWPDPNFQGYRNINLMAQFLIIDEAALRSQLPTLAGSLKPTLHSVDDTDHLLTLLKSSGAKYFNGYGDGICQPAISGTLQRYQIGGVTDNVGAVTCLTTNKGGNYTNMLAGFAISMPVTQPKWSPMNFNVRPLIVGDGIRCDMDLMFGSNAGAGEKAQTTIPYGSAMVWAAKSPIPGKCQIVLLMPWEQTDAHQSKPFLKRTFKINEDALISAWKQQDGKIDEQTSPEWIVDYLIYNAGMNFLPPRNFNLDTNCVLKVYAPQEDLNKIERLFRNIHALSKQTNNEQNNANAIANQLRVAQASPHAEAKQELGLAQASRSTNSLHYSGPGRQKISQKLKSIRFKRVSFKSQPLADVLSKLSPETKSNDPEKEGINFLINPDLDHAHGSGVSEGSEQTNVDMISRSLITIDPPLTNATLGDILDAVVLGASKPIKYSIQDFAVVFSAVKKLPQPLYSRVFMVGTDSFVSGLRRSSGLETNNISALSREYFGTLGVDWNSPAGKAIFYNTNSGKLFVKATAADLDLIERTLSNWMPPAPQIHIEARFVEVPKGTLSTIGQLRNATNTFVSGNQAAILYPRDFQTVYHALHAQEDAEFLGEPEATILSGRQLQMRSIHVITVVTNLAFQRPGGSVIIPQTEKVEIGPVLDVIPKVLSDGYKIHLRMTPSLTEFLGYTKSIRTTNGAVVTPQFNTQKVSVDLTVLDGQTVFIGGMMKSNSALDKVPVIGDLPEAGRLFQNRKRKPVEDEVLVFVTATIVDSADNRIHESDIKNQAVPGYYDDGNPNGRGATRGQ